MYRKASSQSTGASRILQIAIGIFSAIQFNHISNDLPAIYGTFWSVFYRFFIPPTTITILTSFVPSTISNYIIPLCLACLTPVHSFGFPLFELILLCICVRTCFSPCFLLGFVPCFCFGFFFHSIADVSIAGIVTGFIITYLSIGSYNFSTGIKQESIGFHYDDDDSSKVSRSGRRKGKLRSRATKTATLKPNNNNKRSSSSTSKSTESSNAPKNNNTDTKMNIKKSMITIILCTFIFTVTTLSVTILTNKTKVHMKGLIKKHVHDRKLPMNYKILAQNRSNTGLISVIEKYDSHRMLTADKSVLGGIFVMKGYAPDSIFAQFYLHEAVRLSNRGDDNTGKGGVNGLTLCLGVGIGVVTKALREHGCKVEAIELDTSIITYAQDYFSLKGYIHNKNAITYINDKEKFEKYEYVIHDVFSGGFIHPGLLKQSEFNQISNVLKIDGVVAINIVSSSKSSTYSKWVAEIVAKRLFQAFSNDGHGGIRVFSEPNVSEKIGVDNIVMFASKTKSVLQFRSPTNEDYLGSEMRQEVLEEFDRYEVFDVLPKDYIVNGDEGLLTWIKDEVMLWIGMAHVGMAHAKVMDNVHPKELWSALLAAEHGML